MKSRKLIWIFLPILIVSVLLLSLLTPQNIQTDQNTLMGRIEEIQTSNPTPENIQVLGVEDTSDNIEDFSFDTEKLYRLISEYRKEQDLHKLFINKTLEESAHRKLSDMIEKKYFRHADINQYESWYLFNASGYDYEFAGENLSSGYNTPWQVFDAWRKSDVHNEQLLKPEYLDMGLAINCETYEVRNKPACIVVLHLGAR
jgi:uncharacterized protein YkwD